MGDATANELTLEELKACTGETRTSSWMVIDQDRINRFADVTEDHQFIHIDQERAKAETPFGGTIAHGFLSLSVLAVFFDEVAPQIKGAKMGINYGFDKIRFLTPVRSGSRIRAHFKTSDVYEKSPGHILAKIEVSVEIEGEKHPALIAHWLGMTILEQEDNV